MEQENNNDHLDRFLHRAFDDFSANPSDGLWDKIKGDLPQQVPSGKVMPLIRPWHIAASLALMLSLFLMQHFYFASKIEALRDEMQRSPATNAPVTPSASRTAEPGVSSSETVPATENAGNSSARYNTPGESVSAPAATLTTENPGNSSTYNNTPIESISTPTAASANQTIKQDNSDNARPTVKKATGVEPISTQQKLPVNNAIAPPMAMQNGVDHAITPDPVNQDSKAIGKEQSIAAASLLSTPRLPDRLSTENRFPAIKFIGAPFVTQVHQTNRFAVNIHAMPGFIQTKVNLPQPPPNDPHGNDKIFSDKKHSGTTFLVGAGIDKQLNKRWSVVSGIDYLTHSISQTLPSPLQFKDRDHGGGGPGGPGHNHGDEHDFNYYIGTENGTYLVDVELRAKDSTQTIPEEESIDLELNTTHKTSYVSLPVAVKYNYTRKRWTAFLMAGVRINYQLHSNQTLSGFTCKNDMFEFRNQPKLVQKSENIRKISSDVMVSAGIEYRLRHFGFTLSPAFNSPVLKPVKDDRISVSTYWAGVNAGVQYYF